jgi:P27 family predicted phage terminase small subunit
LKIVQGTARADREQVVQFTAPGLVDLSPPDWLDAGGVRRWNEWAPDLTKDGRLTRHDIDAFASLCDAASKVEQISREITPEYLEDATAPHQRVYPLRLSTQENLRKRYDALSAKFGMTPLDRSKLKLPPKPKVDSPLSRFIGTKKKG